jgi:short subunit dehydrogenase-like uncharacterized protein
MSTTSRAGRKFDVLLWGATGFTGRLVAEYLLARYGVRGEIKWAIGGRNRAKLESVRAELCAIDPRAAEIPIVVGDASDRASLDPIVKDARVVCTTVGPYAIYGREMVAACVDAATDYCDLTGETPFIREMIDAHHDRAKKTGARIVHCCGFDSIPSDLGTLMLQEHARALGSRCIEVKCMAGESSGGMSGGTIASMLNIAESAAKDRKIARVLMDPYALDPEGGARGQDGADQRGVRFDEDLRKWTGPFVMAAINTRVVRRSNALLGYAWGKDFRYSESMSFGRGPKGWGIAAGLSVGIAAFIGAAALPPTRKLLARALPAPGEGPSKEKREHGFFVTRLVGITESKNGSSAPAKLLGVVKGQQDPGYGETSKMIGESAVCLAKDDAIPKAGGILTPASSMGMRLVERLRAQGMTFDVGAL